MALMNQFYSTAILPAFDDAQDLGALTKQFKDLYIDGIAYIDAIGENCLITSTYRLQFRDTAIYIASLDDGHLDLMADVSIDFNTIADTDLVLNFFGTTTSGVLTWMEDEDYFKFGDDIMLPGGENIVLDTTTGTKIGTGTNQLLGFYNATPVDQPATVSDAATQDLTGTDTVNQTKLEADLTSVKTAVNTVIDRLQELGLIA